MMKMKQKSVKELDRLSFKSFKSKKKTFLNRLGRTGKRKTVKVMLLHERYELVDPHFAHIRQHSGAAQSAAGRQVLRRHRPADALHRPQDQAALSRLARLSANSPIAAGVDQQHSGQTRRRHLTSMKKRFVVILSFSNVFVSVATPNTDPCVVRSAQRAAR
jgi:hypothetical protein